VRVFAVDDFPKTPSPNGFKIQRNRLRQMAERLLAGRRLPAEADQRRCDFHHRPFEGSGIQPTSSPRG
jgi:hypothetical protein